MQWNLPIIWTLIVMTVLYVVDWAAGIAVAAFKLHTFDSHEVARQLGTVILPHLVALISLATLQMLSPLTNSVVPQDITGGVFTLATGGSATTMVTDLVDKLQQLLA